MTASCPDVRTDMEAQREQLWAWTLAPPWACTSWGGPVTKHAPGSPPGWGDLGRSPEGCSDHLWDSGLFNFCKRVSLP